MNLSIVSSALILIAVVIAVGAVAYGVWRAKKATREISQMAFGTDDIREGFARAEAEYESTPKSLNSITQLALPRIKRDFPEFNLDQMVSQAENVLVSYLRSIDQRDALALVDGTPQLKEALRLRVEMLLTDEQTEQYDRIKVHRTEISHYTKKDGRCVITFQTALQSKHALMDKDGNVITGKPDHWEQSRWETDLIYVQDPQKLKDPELIALGISCPNCSAPITNLGEKYCQYCGTGIKEINIHAWKFNAVRQMK